MKRIRHILQFLSLACIAMTFAVAAQPTTASAASGSLRVQRVQKASVLDSQARKSVTVFCPAGSKVIGAGGKVFNRIPGKLALEDIAPRTDLTGVTVTGVEIDGGTTNNWSVEVFATCVDTIATPVSGLQLVRASSALNSEAAKSAVATCPEGKRVLGAGGQVNGVAGKTVLDEITPLETFVAAVGVGTDGGTSLNWSVDVFATCADKTAVPGLEIVKQEKPVSSNSSQQVVAICSMGKRLIGAGGQINGPSGKVVLTEIAMGLDFSGAVAEETDGGTSAGWSIGTRAICIPS